MLLLFSLTWPHQQTLKYLIIQNSQPREIYSTSDAKRDLCEEIQKDVSEDDEDGDDQPEEVHKDVDDVQVDGERGEDVLLWGDRVLVVSADHHLMMSWHKHL